jgi:hypothetical protein
MVGANEFLSEVEGFDFLIRELSIEHIKVFAALE